MTTDFRRFEIEATGPGQYLIKLLDRTTNRQIEVEMTTVESALFMTLYGRIQERIDFERFSNQH